MQKTYRRVRACLLQAERLSWPEGDATAARLFSLGRRRYRKTDAFVPSRCPGTRLDGEASEGSPFTCTWSSSITGSLVLVDLSAVRFRFTA